jgi:hypothetical protein
MKPYPIEPIDPHTLPGHYHKYWQLRSLEIGQSLRIPDEDLAYTSDPGHTVRSAAWWYGKQLGRKFRTRRLPNGSVLVWREA